MPDMNTINTRIKLKYDSYENWMSNDPVLLSGELAIATIDSTENNLTGTKFQNLPNVVIKVGNGTAKYSELKFVSGLAADVYEWAKAASKPAYTAGEIDGLSDYINTTIKDTDTRYTLIVEESAPYVLKLMATDPDKSDLTYDTLVATIDLSSLDTRLKTVEAALGEDGSVAQQISAAIEAIALAEQTAGQGKVFNTIKQENGIVSVTTRDLGIADIAGLQDALDAKEDDLTFDGEYNAETNKVATVATVTNAIEGLDKADAAVEHQFVTAVSEENGIISVTRAQPGMADISGLEAEFDAVDAEIAKKQDILTIADNYNADTNPVASVATVTRMVADLEGAMHFVGAAESDPLQWADNSKYSAGDVVLWGEYEYVFDGNAWIELGNTSLYQLKSDAETQHKALQDAIDALDEGKQDNVVFDGDYNAETNKAATVATVNNAVSNAIEALDKADAAVEHQFVTAVSEDNGVISVVRAQPAVADINGLEAELNAIDKAIEDLDAAKQNNLTFDGDYNAESNKVATVATVTNAIEGLDKADAAVEGQFVTAVSEENGIVSVTRAAVTTDHITQGAKVLVLDCGTSAL